MEGLDSPLLEPQHGASQLALILNLSLVLKSYWS